MIYRGATKSYRYLSHVILHEFGHVNSIYLGFLFDNAAKYTQNTAIAIDEIYAYKFGLHHGGTPFTSAFQSNAIWLSKTSWNIDARKLPLPSFD